MSDSDSLSDDYEMVDQSALTVDIGLETSQTRAQPTAIHSPQPSPNFVIVSKKVIPAKIVNYLEIMPLWFSENFHISTYGNLYILQIKEWGAS